MSVFDIPSLNTGLVLLVIGALLYWGRKLNKGLNETITAVSILHAKLAAHEELAKERNEMLEKRMDRQENRTR